MHRPLKGFTLPELIIVIAVISILATIVSLAASGYIKSTNDKARETDARQWAATFELYRSRLYNYPAMPTNAATPLWACLGNFPASTGDRCGQYGNVSASYSDSTATSMLTEVQKVGKAPTNVGSSIDGKFIGPLLYITQDVDVAPINVTAHFVNFFQQKCPDGFNNVTSTAPYSNLKTGQTSNATLVCELPQSFTYNPN